jgi:competence protein ComEC
MKFLLVYYLFFGLHFGLRNIKNSSLLLYFLNVGQGDSILIKSEDQIGLVDGGPDFTLDYAVDNKIPFFKCNIGYILATHPHKDHVEGLARVLKRCKVKYTLINSIEYETKSWERFIDLAKNKSELHTYPKLPIQLSKNYKVKYFALGQHECKHDINICSLVMLIQFQTSRVPVNILLTGDIPVKHLTSLDKQHIDIVKVPHHGGIGTLSQSFLEKTQPKYAVLSYGKGNRYGHPHAETTFLLAQNNVHTLHTTTGDALVKVYR